MYARHIACWRHVGHKIGLRLLGIFQSSIADDESETRLKLLGLTKKTFSDYEDCNDDDRPRSGKMYIVQGGKRGAETPLDTQLRNPAVHRSKAE